MMNDQSDKSDKSDLLMSELFRKEPAMNKITVFSFVFLMMICGSAWTQQTLEDDFDVFIKPYHQQIDFCFLISSQDSEMELLFGTCDNSSDAEQWELIPGTPADDPDDISFDFYFFHTSKAYDVFFTENRQEAEWILVVKTSCSLNFTLLDGAAPGAGGSLKLFNGGNELLNIVNGSQTGEQLDAGQYTIKYVPAPEKSIVTADVTFEFQTGWNLLHLPIVVYSDQRRADDNWDTLLNLPRMTLSGRTYVKGGDIRCGEAFWVFYDGRYAEDNHTLTVLGYEPLATDWAERPSTGDWDFANTNEVSANIYEWAGRYKIPTSLDSSKGYWINTPQ